jgi:uncharacterized protein (DUF433 family)
MASVYSQATSYQHIHLNNDGVPFVAETTMKVIELVMAQQAYGWSPEELHFQHPYLSMSQIHSALAYYWANKETMDAAIEESLKFADQSRQMAEPSPLVEKIKRLNQTKLEAKIQGCA